MLGDNIMQLRKQKGMSQQELADQLHVVRQTISKWEKNLSVPDADALLRLADALDVTVPVLLGEAVQEKAAPSDIAVALGRINEQLAVQNRRRSTVWKVIAWVMGVLLAVNVLQLVLSYTYSVDMDRTVEEHSVVVETIEEITE